MINDVQNFFAIPEEKGENESEEDTTKKNFKKSSKEKSIINEHSEKKIPSKAKKEDKEKNKSAFRIKKCSVFLQSLSLNLHQSECNPS